MPENTYKNKAKILIVDDEVLIAKDLESRLQALGYSVCGKAASGKQAFELVEQHQPDLVMMDIVLPGKMEGIDTAEAIRERWGIPVVFLTAYAEEDRLKRARLAYPFGYLLKPLRDRDLKITVEMALYVAKVDKEQRKAEEALRESEEKFRHLYETMTQGVVLQDAEGKIVEANRAASDILGLTRDQLFGRTAYDPRWKLIREDGFPYDPAEIPSNVALRTGKTVKDVTCGIYVPEKNEYRWILIGSAPQFRGSETEPSLTMTVFTDITERKLAEEDLRKSEMQMSSAANIARLGPWELDIDTGMFTFTDAFYAVYRTTAEREGGYTMPLEDYVRRFVHPEDAAMVASETQKAIETDDSDFSQRIEHRILYADGKTGYISVHWFVVKNEEGRTIKTYGVNQDITDRRQAEEALRESEAFIRAVMDNLPIGFAVNTIDNGDVIFINKRFEEIYGWPRDELTNVSIFFEKVFPDPEFREEMKTKIIADMQSGDPDRMNWNNLKIVTSEGEERFVFAYNIPMIDKNLMISTVQDVTKQKQAREEREKLHEQLTQAQKMEAVGTLAGGIAHDFNNLLQAMSGYTQLLLMEKSKTDPEYKSLIAIQDAGFRASDLVRQLLLFSRKADSTRRPIELQNEVEQAKKILERTIPRMIEIQVNMGNRLWTINADPVQIEQLLLNLGTNAADAMPDGGKLLFEIENTTLDDDYVGGRQGVRPSRYVLLTVSDTGIGMDKATKEKIFEPFFTTKEFGKGTGLGLASVYGIVKSHGGYITCYSEVGQGATFKIYFPAIVQPEVEETKEDKPQPIPRGTETILLVDDEEAIRGFAQQALMKFGYKVMTASTGDEALELSSAKPNEIDLVVMDLGMPGMGGHKCLQELLKLNPEVKVLIASGYSINGQVKESMEAGAKGFVGKPYQLADLLNTVRAVLDE